MMELVDTHCHIQSVGLSRGEKGTRQLWAKEPELDAEKVVNDAVTAGVTRLICVGCELEDSRLATEFVKARENCWASIGIHPHEAKDYGGNNQKLEEFAKLATADKVVAIGETGLDYYYEHSPMDAQKELLKFQLELAQKHNLPVIFHVREAFEDFWHLYEPFSGLKGVLHSFTDSLSNMQKAVENSLYIGVNGIATFAKDENQLNVYKSIPLEKLVLETDAPFLTPTPFRGSVNEPKQVRTIAKFLAELRGESLETLTEATTANARQLFSI